MEVAAAREVARVGVVGGADGDGRPVGGRPGAGDGGADEGEDGVGLRGRDAVVLRNLDVRLALRGGLGTGGERGDGDEFARTPVEDVPSEDVAEKVRLEVGVELREEVEKRAGDGAAAKARLVGGAGFEA